MAFKASIFARGLTMALLSTAMLTGCINDGSSSDLEADGIARSGDIKAAKVGSSYIYQSDVRRAAAAQNLIEAGELIGADDPIYTDVLEELIDQRLLKLAAIETGLEAEAEVKRRLFETRERILAAYLVESRLEETVTEDSLKQIYSSQSALRQNSLEARVRIIRVETEAEIKVAAEKLAAGEDFGKLALELSIDASKSEDGSLGYVSRVMLADEVAEAVFSTQAGKISEPFETQGGWAIVEVMDFRKPAQASYESMRAQLKQYKTYSEVQNLMTKLREDKAVEIFVNSADAKNEANDE